MKLSDNRYEEIKEIASNMLAYCRIDNFKINSFEIALKLDYVVIPYSSFTLKEQSLLLKNSEDGFSVVRYDNRRFIYYNDQKRFVRINSTIMHEIGHLFLNHSEESQLAEAEAKFFAKYALAPPVLIHKIKPNSHNDIYEKFNISFEASKYAFNYYNNWLSQLENYTEYEKLILRAYRRYFKYEVR